MKINVRLIPNEKTSFVSFSPDEFDMTEEEWESLSKSEQEEFIKDKVDSLPDTPYWVIDYFETD